MISSSAANGIACTEKKTIANDTWNKGSAGRLPLEALEDFPYSRKYKLKMLKVNKLRDIKGPTEFETAGMLTTHMLKMYNATNKHRHLMILISVLSFKRVL